MLIMIDKYDIRKIFGSSLKELRESKKLTQEQLAEYLDLQSYQTINRIENGKSFTTSLLLEKMCKFFNVPPAYFFNNHSHDFEKEHVDYLNEIKQILPLLSTERLKDIYNIAKTFNK